MGLSTRDREFLGYEFSGGVFPTHDVSWLLTDEQRQAGLRLVEDPNHEELSLRLVNDWKVVRYIAQFDMASVSQRAIHDAADIWLASRTEVGVV